MLEEINFTQLFRSVAALTPAQKEHFGTAGGMASRAIGRSSDARPVRHRNGACAMQSSGLRVSMRRASGALRKYTAETSNISAS